MMTPEDERELLEVLRKRHSMVGRLIEVSERICQKLESPTASVTIIDQADLRSALDELKRAGAVEQVTRDEERLKRST